MEQQAFDANKKKPKRNKGRIIVAVCCFALALGGLGYSFYNYSIYAASDRHNDALMENIVFAPPEDTSVNIRKSRAASEISYPNLEIDYENLSAINPDFVGVLYVPALELVYPVVHSHDEAEYLKLMFDGTPNNGGAIFLSMYAEGDFSSTNSIIYGHNMRNGSMFAPLKRFREEEGLADSDPYIYLYTPDGVNKYHIFAYYLAGQPDVCYGEIENYKQYDKYIETALDRSEYVAVSDDYADPFDRRPKLLTLSTCGNNQGTKFTVVNATLVGKGNAPY